MSGDLRERLRDVAIPGDEAARERGLELVRAAYAQRDRQALRERRTRARVQVALAACAAVAIAVVAATPPGAAVAKWIRDVVAPGHPHARRALVSLPAPGPLLVDSEAGPWIVQPDGSKRLLGPYHDAAWSPHGLFVAAVRGHQLLALDPRGTVRWTLARPQAPHDPRWSPDGYRIAYRSGRTLRLVAGDGTGDRLAARRIAPIAAAWRPGGGHVLTFAERNGNIRTIAADTGRTLGELGRISAGSTLSKLEWSRDGRRLLVLTPAGVTVLDRRGRPSQRAPVPAGSQAVDAAFEPGSHRIAVVRSDVRLGRSELVVMSPSGDGFTVRQAFAGAGALTGVAYSADARWLLLSWRDPDQWLFIRSARVRRVVAVSDIARQFDPGGTGRAPFPRVDGWCCAP